MAEWRLCDLRAIGDGQARGFELDDGLSVFVLRRGDAYFAYLNRCPHTGVELNWQPDQFLDSEGRYIQCSMHGALFRVEDGACLRGPCAGQALTPITLRVRDDGLYLAR